MMFIYVSPIVEQNERIPTLQELLKSVDYRNSSEAFKITPPGDLLLKTQLSAMPAAFQCDFDHNSMRTQSIFDIVDYLNRAHFQFQNEPSFVYFTYWVQMLLWCEIVGIAEQLRDAELRSLIICRPNPEAVGENFF